MKFTFAYTKIEHERIVEVDYRSVPRRGGRTIRRPRTCGGAALGAVWTA